MIPIIGKKKDETIKELTAALVYLGSVVEEQGLQLETVSNYVTHLNADRQTMWSAIMDAHSKSHIHDEHNNAIYPTKGDKDVDVTNE